MGNLNFLRILRADKEPPVWPPNYTRWEPLAEAIKEQLKGDWYRVADSRPNPSLAKNINSDRVPSFGDVAGFDGRFEAKALKNVWDSYDIYVRFVAF